MKTANNTNIETTIATLERKALDRLDIATVAENNRFTVDQLKKADFGNDALWTEYNDTVTALVKAVWRMRNGDDEQAGEIARCSARLFQMFHIDCKTWTDWTRRFWTCCIGYKTLYSAEYKALKNKRDEIAEKLEQSKSNPAEQTLIDGATVDAVKTLERAVELMDARLEEMRHEPGNVWKEWFPLLNSKRTKATKSAFKRIEDELVDIKLERDMMSEYDLYIEKEMHKAERKVRDRVKATAK